MEGDGVDPLHDDVPGIRWALHPDGTYAVLQMVFAVAGALWFDEGLDEVRIAQSCLAAPVLLGTFLVVAFVEVQLKRELGVRLYVRANPLQEKTEGPRISICHVYLVSRLVAFYPIEDQPSYPQRVLGQFGYERPCHTSQLTDLFPSPPVGINRSARNLCSTFLDRTDLLVGQRHLTTPGRQG